MITGYGKHLGVQRAFLLLPVGAVLPVQVESFEIDRGELVKGGLDDLQNSDDFVVSVKSVREDFRSRVFVIFIGVCPLESPSRLEFSIESSVLSGIRGSLFSTVRLSIDFYDFDAGSWEEIYAGRPSNFGDSTRLVVAGGDLSRFVQTGGNQIKARCRYESSRRRQGFSANLDHVFWNIGS